MCAGPTKVGPGEHTQCEWSTYKVGIYTECILLMHPDEQPKTDEFDMNYIYI